MWARSGRCVGCDCAVSPSRDDDELDVGSPGRRERLHDAYAGQRTDLLRLARGLGVDERAAELAVSAAYAALERRPWVRDPVAFLRARVARTAVRPPAAPRRRRGAVMATLALVVAAATVLGVRAAGRHGPAPVASAPLAPAVEVPAPAVGTVPLGRYGLAVLADPGVEVLDATDGHTALLSPAAKGATAIGVSHDGRFVAALVGPDTVEVLDQSDDLRWTGPAARAAWSPTTDVLALDGPSGVEFLTPLARGYRMQSTAWGSPAADPTGLVWRPDGSAVAVGTDDALAIVSAAGEPAGSAEAPAGTALAPVTWSADGRHLLVFVEPDGTALNTFGVRVLSATAAGGQVTLGRQLGSTLPQPGWWSADARTSVLGVLGTGHGAVEQQRVVRCDLTAGTCDTVASGAVADPVATASGIAYLSEGNGSDGTVVLADADGSRAHAAAGAPAAEQVLADGDVLLLAGSNGVYRYAAGSARLLTAIGTDGAAGQGTEIVAWQPNARSSQ